MKIRIVKTYHPENTEKPWQLTAYPVDGSKMFNGMAEKSLQFAVEPKQADYDDIVQVCRDAKEHPYNPASDVYVEI